MIYLVLAFTVLFVYLAYRRLDWAVMFLLAALPSYLIRFEIFGLPSTLLEIMILSVFAVWFSQNWKNILGNLKNRTAAKNRYPFDLEIVLLLVVALISVGVSGFTDQAFGIWKAYFFEPILLFIVLFNILALPDKNDGVAKADSSVEIPNSKFQIPNKILNFKSKIQNIILWPLAVSALAVSLLAIFQKTTGELIANPLWAAEDTRRVVSFFGYPNAVGLYLAPLIPLLVGWSLSPVIPGRSEAEGKGNQKKIPNFEFLISNGFFNFRIFKLFFISITVFLSLLSIIFAKSVGALFGAMAGLIVFGLIAGKKSRIATIVIIVIASAGILSFIPARHAAYEYLTLNDFSGQVRKAQWTETWAMLADGHLVSGAGLANYQRIIAPYHKDGIFIEDIYDKDWLRKALFNKEFRKKAWQPLEIYLYPHNILLNFWTELGLAGMILFVWLIGKFLYLGARLIHNGNTLILGLIGAMVAVVVQGLVDVPYFKNDLSAMFWVMLALVGMLDLDNKKTAQ